MEEHSHHEPPREEEKNTPLLPSPDEPIDLQDDLPPMPKAKKDRHWGLPIILSLLLCIGMLTAVLLLPARREEAEESPQTDAQTEDEAEETETDRIIFIRGEEEGDGLLTPQEIYEASHRAVVSILRDSEQTVRGGFLYADGSYVATTYGAISGETTLRVRFYDGSIADADVVAANPFADLALLKVEKRGGTPLPTAGGASLLAGDAVFSLGCAATDLNDSFVHGIVSHPQRKLTVTDDLQIPQKTVLRIQTTLPCSVTFCGSPLLNEQGAVVGILSSDGTHAFAIPMQGAVPILDAMLRGETPSDALLAAVSIPLPSLGVVGDGEKTENGVWGVRIRSFSDASADVAKKLRVGDLITHVGGVAVTNAATLEKEIRNHLAGETVSVTVYRAGQSLTFPVILTRFS